MRTRLLEAALRTALLVTLLLLSSFFYHKDMFSSLFFMFLAGFFTRPR